MNKSKGFLVALLLVTICTSVFSQEKSTDSTSVKKVHSANKMIIEIPDVPVAPGLMRIHCKVTRPCALTLEILDSTNSIQLMTFESPVTWERAAGYKPIVGEFFRWRIPITTTWPKKVTARLYVDSTDSKFLSTLFFIDYNENITEVTAISYGVTIMVPDPIVRSKYKEGIINYWLRENSDVKIEILKNREVIGKVSKNDDLKPIFEDTLKDLEKGLQSYYWNLKTSAGKDINAGYYYVRLRCYSRVTTKKQYDMALSFQVQ
jgi:hypothetical protein